MPNPVWNILNVEMYNKSERINMEQMYDFLHIMENRCGQTSMKILFNMMSNYGEEFSWIMTDMCETSEADQNKIRTA